MILIPATLPDGKFLLERQHSMVIPFCSCLVLSCPLAIISLACSLYGTFCVQSRCSVSVPYVFLSLEREVAKEVMGGFSSSVISVSYNYSWVKLSSADHSYPCTINIQIRLLQHTLVMGLSLKTVEKLQLIQNTAAGVLAWVSHNECKIALTSSWLLGPIQGADFYL